LFLDLAVNFALETRKNFRWKLADGGAVAAGVKFSRAAGCFPL
jgi:hypothetical protein